MVKSRYWGNLLLRQIGKYQKLEKVDKEFKAVFQNLKNQLPHILPEFVYDIADSENVILPMGKQHYDFMNQKLWHTEKDCVYALTGIEKLDSLVFSEVIFDLLNKRTPMLATYWCDYHYTKEQNFKRRALEYLLLEIKEMISIGIIKKEIEHIKNPMKEGFCKIYQNSIKFDSISFYKWANKNFYPIPDELNFENKDDVGQSVEIDINKQCNNLESIQQKIRNDEIKEHNLEKTVKSLIQSIRPEVDNFYELLKLHVNKRKLKTLDINYEHALEIFESNKDKFKNINSEDIHKKHFGSEKPYREIKGGIMRNILIRKYPQAKAHTNRINLSAQALYSLSNDLKKS